jgi:hypothetical protein
MARTITEIHEAILADIRSREDLAGLTSTSATSLYVLFAYVVAVAIATLENLFDLAGIELRDMAAQLKPHTLRWYQARALAFRLGVDLLQDRTEYPEEPDAELVAEQQIIRYASVREAGTQVQVKVAKEGIEPLSAAELAAFQDYIAEVKDAGVLVEVSSDPADTLQATIDIYYNAQIIDGQGRRVDGTDDRVIENAVRAYCETLRFDGLFVNAHLVDQLQRTPGIQIPVLKAVEITADGDPAAVPVSSTYEPRSGFVRLDNGGDLAITYIPYDDA